MNLSLSPEAAVCAAYGLNVLLMVTTIALLVLLAARCALRHDASARYLLCLTALICILLVPVVVVVLSKSHIDLVEFALPNAAQPQSLPAVDPALIGNSVPESPLHGQNLVGWVGLLQLLLPIWALGALWGALRLVWGWRMTVRLRRMAQPLDVAELSSVLEQVQRTLGSSAPPICTSERIDSPVAVGVLRPAVILPEGMAEALTPAQLRHVLLHECAHIAFRHAFGGVAQRLAGLMYWPHPLVAALCREMTRAREEISDNVASQEDGAACYARTLLTIAQGLSTAPYYASALALLGPETSLERRISGLLDPRRNRMVGVKRWKLWAVTGGVALSMVLAATVRVVADDSQTQQETKQQSALQAQEATREQQAEAELKRAQEEVAHARQELNRLKMERRSHSRTAGAQSTRTTIRVTAGSDGTVSVDNASGDVKVVRRATGNTGQGTGAQTYTVILGSVAKSTRAGNRIGSTQSGTLPGDTAGVTMSRSASSETTGTVIGTTSIGSASGTVIGSSSTDGSIGNTTVDTSSGSGTAGSISIDGSGGTGVSIGSSAVTSTRVTGVGGTVSRSVGVSIGSAGSTTGTVIGRGVSRAGSTRSGSATVGSTVSRSTGIETPRIVEDRFYTDSHSTGIEIPRITEDRFYGVRRSSSTGSRAAGISSGSGTSVTTVTRHGTKNSGTTRVSTGTGTAGATSISATTRSGSAGATTIDHSAGSRSTGSSSGSSTTDTSSGGSSTGTSTGNR